MNVDPQQIASIVQAVLQQLQHASPSAAPVAVTPASPAAVPLVAGSAVAGSAGTLKLTDPVVTWELLRGRLSGIQLVQVGPRTVITPLVRDELRRLGIRLERGTSPLAAPQHASCVGGLLVRDETRWTAEAVAQGTGAAWSVQRGLDELLTPLRSSAEGAYRHAVVVTPRWAELAWQIGRDTGLRAVAVHSVATLEQAWLQLQPQVLVVNSSLQSLASVQAIVQAFATRVRVGGTAPSS